MNKKIVVSTAVVVVALLIAPTVAMGQEIEVNQSVDTTSPGPSDNITVAIEINATGLASPAVDSRSPAGWSVVSRSDDGGMYRRAGMQWIWLSGGSYSPSYTVTMPESVSPGRYVLVAEASAVDRATGNRLVDSVYSYLEVLPDEQRPLGVSHNPMEPGLNETVTFEAEPEGSIQSYEWSFEDGSTQTGDTATRTYETKGSHVASLRITYEDGTEGVIEKAVTVGSGEVGRSIPIGTPVVSFNNTPESPNIGEKVSFDASDSFDEEGEVVEYEWDFDNDGEYESTGRETERSFESEGNYSVTLRVTDTSGAINTTSRRVTVSQTDNSGLPTGAVAVVVALIVLVVFGLVAREVR